MSDTETKRFNYEGMFLVSQQSASDVNAVVTHIKEILEKAGAEIIALKKWEERRLAFEISKQKRGFFFLAYFSCDGSKLVGIERDCNLSETILRSMVLRVDYLTLEEMQAADGREELATEAALREASAAKAAQPEATADVT